jgi:hypothetical protein
LPVGKSPGESVSLCYTRHLRAIVPIKIRVIMTWSRTFRVDHVPRHMVAAMGRVPGDMIAATGRAAAR